MDENRYTNDYYTNQNQMNQGQVNQNQNSSSGTQGTNYYQTSSAVADESSAGKTRKTEKTIRWIW